jgi:hypothetical protein
MATPGIGERETSVPVLLLAFSRPDTTAVVLDSLRAVRPERLFFAVDGPRPDRQGERERVTQVRRLVQRIDWPCRVETLFRDRNLGCRAAVSEAITWFLDHVEAGIILEDDCTPHPSFFRFAAELLERFAHDDRVFMISGDNFQFGRRRGQYSYYFSRYTHIWGWATWRRAWKHYDDAMSAWPARRDQAWLAGLLGDRAAAEYWTRVFDATREGRNDSWAYRWTYSAWIREALTILPAVNLVSNIGFGDAATHTRLGSNRLARLPVQEMRFPLMHPLQVTRDEEADRFTQRTVFSSGSFLRRAARAVYRRLFASGVAG